MAIARYIVVDASGDIVNAVLVEDTGSSWVTPAGHSVVASEEYNIGGTLIEGVYTPPSPEE